MVDETMDMVRSKELLKKYIGDEVTKLFTSVLDYAEVAVDGRDRYKVLRSRILKVSNDKIREIQRQLDMRYQVTYVPDTEDVIQVTRK